MTRSILSTIAIVIGGLALDGRAVADEAAGPFEQQIRPFLAAHCVRCHGAEKQEGQLRLDTLSADFTNRDAAIAWLEVRDRLNLGEMPPEDEPQPTGDDVASVAKWIAGEMRRVERSAKFTGGRVPLRRLNRDEFAYTVADLLQMKFAPGESPRELLPPDGTAEGFDKVASALLLDPSLATSYYRIARRVAEKAIVDGPPEYSTEKMRLEFEEIADSRAIGYLLRRLGMKAVPGGLLLVEGSTRSFGMLRYPGRRDNNVAPVKGFYRFTLRVGGAPGEDGERPRVRIRHSHPSTEMQKVMEFEVDAPFDQPKEYSVVIPRDELGGEINVSLVNETKLYTGQRPGENFMRRIGDVGKEGKFDEVIRLRGRWAAEGAYGDRSVPDPEKLDVAKYPRVFLDWLEVEGPLYDAWPPRSHQRLFFEGEDAKQDLDYARRMFERFLPLAWRRPIDPNEADPIVRVVERELEAGQSFEEAIRAGLVATLVSPNFLYVGEPTDTGAEPLGHHGVASRLSYFLWSSMPDERLRELASDSTLHDPTVLEEQVDRMLDDEKSDRFVDGFARQWLRTDTFLAFAPDRSLYRDFDEELGEAAVRQPVEFFRTVLREDRPVSSFLDSDFTVVNERLARHYGWDGVAGEEFAVVPVPRDSNRGGLLGMMGVHMAGSDGVRTKPVSRGVYIREVLFNDPPDPPPPNAGEIEPNIAGENLTVRDRLIQHQKIAACAACHRGIDPYGLALENFNVIGRWRDQQDGEGFRRNAPPIDASGRLPNGEEFETFEEFRALLAVQDDRFPPRARREVARLRPRPPDRTLRRRRDRSRRRQDEVRGRLAAFAAEGDRDEPAVSQALTTSKPTLTAS